MRERDKYYLKIDLDIRTKSKAIKEIKERLSYLVDMKFVDISDIEYIKLIFKTNHSCRIKLKLPLANPMIQVVSQLLLGSDYRKELQTLINYYTLNMEYYNRMFDIKRYVDGTIRESKYFDITKEIIDYIKSKDRKKHNS